MSIALLEKARDVSARRSQDAEEAFAALVLAIADGTAPDDPEHVADVLEAVGKKSNNKSPAELHDELLAAVELAKNRRQWFRQVTEANAAVAEIAHVTAQIAKIEADIEAFHAKSIETARPLHERVRYLENLRIAANSATSSLYQTASAALLAEIAEANQAIARVDRTLRALQTRRVDRLGALSSLEQEYARKDGVYTIRGRMNTSPQGTADEIERLKDSIKADDAAINDLGRELNELRVAEKTLAMRRLLP